MARLLFILTSIILLYSCEKEVESKSIHGQSKMVISGIFTSNSINIDNSFDNTFNIQLHESDLLGNSSDDYPVIKGANIRLFENNNFLEILSFDNESQSYRSAAIAQEGGEYSIFIEHPDYPEVEAFSKIPFPASIGSTTPSPKTGELPTLGGDAVEGFEISFELEDPAEENYYHILFYHNIVDFQLQGLDTVYVDSKIFATTFNLSVESETNAILSNESLPFYGAFLTDEHFNNATKVLNFNLRYTLKPTYQVADNLWVEVRTVSKEYYDFYTTTLQNVRTGFNPFGNPPIPVESNIENGLGIFGGFSHTVKSVKLPR